MLVLADMQGAGMVGSLREAAWLDSALVSDMLGRLDAMLDHWCGTSTMTTSTEDAEAKGYRLVYLPPGMSEKN